MEFVVDDKDRFESNKFESPNHEIVNATKKAAQNVSSNQNEIFEFSKRNIYYVGELIPDCTRNIKIKQPVNEKAKKCKVIRTDQSIKNAETELIEQVHDITARKSTFDFLVKALFLLLLSYFAFTIPKYK